jgi:hypothetical protein
MPRAVGRAVPTARGCLQAARTRFQRRHILHILRIQRVRIELRHDAVRLADTRFAIGGLIPVRNADQRRSDTAFTVLPVARSAVHRVGAGRNAALPEYPVTFVVTLLHKERTSRLDVGRVAIRMRHHRPSAGNERSRSGQRDPDH